jgi:cytochrome c553
MRAAGVVLFTLLSAAAAAQDVAQTARGCAQCHRPDYTAGELPLLEGQHAAYLRTQLERFRDAHRDAFPMSAIAQALEPDEIDALARHFAGRPWQAHPATAPAATVDAGRRRAAELQCANCHGAGYGGAATIPRLAGQNPEYLARQLRAFGDGRRYHPTTGIGSRMYALSDADVAALSRYLASRDERPDLGWLAGHWCGGADGARAEEWWTDAAGGLMLGTHRDVRDGRVAFFEFLRIEFAQGVATYRAQPLGRAPATDFAATDVGPLYAVFENPRHDFPKRIRYERRDDTLVATVDDGQGGAAQRWEWGRECPGR